MRLRYVTVLALALTGCGARQDEGFGELQERGRSAMGVDQYTSTHTFDSRPDGGRIELQRDENETRDVATIRAHLKEVMAAFERGDFSTPAFVHAGEVPGTKLMAARRSMIRYSYADLPRGGEIRISTSDPAALQAIHEFLSFQRKDHRAGGHEH